MSPLGRRRGGTAELDGVGPSGAGPAGGPSASSHVLRGALAMLSTQPFTWAASLLTTIFIPRYLGDADLGEVALAQSVALLAGAFLSLGVPTALVRGVAARPERSAADGTSALVLLMGVSVPIALGIFVLWPLFVGQLVRTDILALALANMIVGQASGVVTSILVGKQRHLQFAWITAASALGNSLLGVAVLIAGGGVIGFLLVGLLASIVVTVVGWRLARVGLDAAGLAPAAIVRMARAGLPFLGMAVSNRIRIDLEVVYLGSLVGASAVGLWAAAGRVVWIPLFIPNLIVTPLLPALTQTVADRPALGRTLRRSLETVTVLTVGPSAGILALAPAVPGLLGWDPSYGASAPIIAVLAASLPLIGISMVLGTSLTALGDERRWLAVGVAATVLHGVVSIGLIALFAQRGENGALGSALARVLTEIVIIGGAIWLLPRGFVGWSFAHFLARVLAAAAALVLAVSWLLPIWLPLAVVGGGLVYAAALLALGAVRPGELLHAGGVAQAALKRRLGRAA